MSRAPVKNTCPDIDKMIKACASIVTDLNTCNFSEAESLCTDVVEDVIVDIMGFPSTLEELRSANSALRDWGNDEANRVDELESEQEELRNENDELKREIERLNSQLERYDN